MVLNPVLCPVCRHEKIATRGKTENGKQRYLCQNLECSVKTFILDYDYHGYLPHVKNQIIDMAINGSSIWDTARVLDISDHRH
jgi:transposase-like protein